MVRSHVSMLLWVLFSDRNSRDEFCYYACTIHTLSSRRYVIVLFSLFHLNALVLVATPTAIDAGVLLLFYGMYYGVLCRDIAEICSDRMASRIGYYRYYSLTGVIWAVGREVGNYVPWGAV